jgi:hypothetical protein
MSSVNYFITDGDDLVRTYGSCQESVLHLIPIPDGCSIKVNNDLSLGQSPTPWHRWSMTEMAWVNTQTLDGAKAAKWELVKQWRAEAIVAPTITTPFGVMHADAQGVSDVKDALLGRREAESLGIALAPIKWTLVDNSVAELTTSQLGLVAVMLLSRGDTYHQRARALRKQIDDATTPAELDAITRGSLEIPLPEESVTTEETA